LEMAKDHVWTDFHSKFAGWSTVVEKEGDEVVTKVEMPAVPGTEEVLAAANKFIEFVNGNKPK
jgi:hypothetical protein